MTGIVFMQPSPCVKVCTIDKESGWCLGCGRTVREIAEWAGATPERCAEIRAELPARLKQLGVD